MEQRNFQINQSIATQRLDYVDVIKGIAIMMVVIGHICQNNPWLIKDGLDNDVATWVSCVHMPVFFFMSGLLMALTDKKHRSRWNNMWRKAKMLLIPYFVWAFAIKPYCLDKPLPSLNFIVHPEAGCWYLVYVLVFAVIYELISIAIEKLKPTISLQVKEGLMLVGSVGLFMSLYVIFPCESYKRFVSFAMFYFLGVIFYNHNLFVKISKSGGVTGLCFVVYVVCSVLYKHTSLTLFSFGANSSAMDLILKFAASISFTIVLVHFFETNKAVYQNKIVRTFAYMGKNSIVIYMTHVLFLAILHNPSNTQLPITQFWTFIIATSIVSVTVCASLLIGRVVESFPYIDRLLYGRGWKK